MAVVEPDPFAHHSNGATNVSGARLRVEEPRNHTGFLRAFTGVESTDDGHIYDLAHGRQLRVTASPSEKGVNAFSGFGVQVPDLGAVARQLTMAGIPHERVPIA